MVYQAILAKWIAIRSGLEYLHSDLYYCRTPQNLQFRHTGEGPYPVLSSTFWIQGQARNDRNKYYSDVSH